MAKRPRRSTLSPADRLPRRLELCLFCGRRLDAADSFETEKRPAKNDFTLCIHCGSLMVFDSRLRLRKPTQADIEEAQKDPELMAILQAIHLSWKER